MDSFGIIAVTHGVIAGKLHRSRLFAIVEGDELIKSGPGYLGYLYRWHKPIIAPCIKAYVTDLPIQLRYMSYWEMWEFAAMNLNPDGLLGTFTCSTMELFNNVPVNLDGPYLICLDLYMTCQDCVMGAITFFEGIE